MILQILQYSTMHFPLLIGGLAVALLTGCASQPTILPAGNRVVRVDVDSVLLKKYAHFCEVLQDQKIRLSEPGVYTTISGIDVDTLRCDIQEREDLPLKGWKGKLEDDQIIIGGFEGYESIHYTDSRIVLQGLSVALKFRPKVTGQDALPSTVESGFNPALAFGYQYRLNRYSPQKNAFGNNVLSLGFTGGLFAGVSAIGLKSANTSGADLEVDRSVPAASLGIFGLVGFDRINIGFAVGFDHAFGNRSDDWLYQNKSWFGVSVGLDLVK